MVLTAQQLANLMPFLQRAAQLAAQLRSLGIEPDA